MPLLVYSGRTSCIWGIRVLNSLCAMQSLEPQLLANLEIIEQTALPAAAVCLKTHLMTRKSKCKCQHASRDEPAAAKLPSDAFLTIGSFVMMPVRWSKAWMYQADCS